MAMEAIEGYIELLVEQGEPIPDDTIRTACGY
jgi:predicted RNase H-like HicB family nuclease